MVVDETIRSLGFALKQFAEGRGRGVQIEEEEAPVEISLNLGRGQRGGPYLNLFLYV